MTPEGRKRLALVVLTMVGVASHLDRHILGLALPFIRSEFRIGDGWLGFLSGPVFAVAYSVAGFPLARIADRVGRRRVIAGALAFFSATTAACGLAGGLWQLASARCLTGIGEAGTTSPGTALISDLYQPPSLTGALSCFAASSNLGLVLAFFFGGWIVDHFGWRSLFVVSGCLGFLVLAALIVLVEEPEADRSPAATTPAIAVILRLFAQSAFVWVVVGAAIASTSGYAAAAFLPSFLVRSHHLSASATGVVLATLAGTVGWAGTALPGWLAERWHQHDPGIALKVAAVGLIVALPFQIPFYLAPDLRIALVAAIPPVFASAIFLGPCFSAVQRIAPVELRAQATALLLLVLNLVGIGVGPQLVGIVSSTLHPVFGEQALRYALAIVVAAPLAPAAACFWFAGGTLQRAREDQASREWEAVPS